MGLFSAIVKTAINVATTPLAIAYDVISLGGSIDNNGNSHTLEHLEKIKEEAED